MGAINEFNFDPKTRIEQGQRQIFDPIRKNWFLLTPEEFVRQFYVSFMSIELQYPISWMKCEVEVKGAGPKKRADLIIHDSNGRPAIICEFKAMNVSIDSETIFQAARYNRDLGAKFVFVANGKEQQLIRLDLEHGNHEYSQDLPTRLELD